MPNTVLLLQLPMSELGMIGVGKSLRPPLPPNRASGFPAHGSPVDGFLIGIGTLPHGLRVR